MEEKDGESQIGKTNLLVTRLGWGGIPIQRVGEEDAAVSVIRAVIEMGVDLYDTSPRLLKQRTPASA